MMELRLIKKVDHFEDVSSFVFEPLEKTSWIAGQYIEMTIGHRDADSRGIKRIFSISSAPFEDNIVITTRFDFENGSSFKKALRSLKEKDSVLSSRPKGDFLIHGNEKSVLFIAAGIGITPFRSIILDLVHKKSSISLEMIYSSRKNKVLFKDELDRIFDSRDDFKIFYTYSPQRIDEEMIVRNSRFFDEATVFVSGPAKMVKDITEECQNLGKDKNDIKRDYFIGYQIT